MSGKKQIDIEKLLDSMLEDVVPAVSEERGRRLAEPEEEIRFSPEHEERMRKLFQKERRSANRKRLAKYTRRAALFLLAAIFVSGIAVMSVDAWRVRIMNYFMEITQEKTAFRFEDEAQGDKYSTDELTLDYIPNGFELKESVAKMDGLSLIFKNIELYFYVVVAPVEGTMEIDTEDANIKKIRINNFEGTYSIKDDKNILVWKDGEYVFQIIGNINEQEIIKIAENLKK